MAKQVPVRSVMVYQDYYPTHPVDPQTQIPFTFQLDSRKNRITEKEFGPFGRYVFPKEDVAAAEHEGAQQSFMMRTKNPPEFLGSDAFLESHPLVKESVRFRFEDDYGDRLFLDLKREVMWRNVNAAAPRHGGKYFGDVATESDMINEFLDSLF